MALLHLLALLSLAQASVHHDCRQIELSYQKRTTVASYAACETFISLDQMRADMAERLGYGPADVCQSDDGFGPLTSSCAWAAAACPTPGSCNKDCTCSVTWKAWRVHKEDQPGVSCAIGDYAARITGQPYVPTDFTGVRPLRYVLATTTNNNVHCGHR